MITVVVRYQSRADYCLDNPYQPKVRFRLLYKHIKGGRGTVSFNIAHRQCIITIKINKTVLTVQY